MMGATVKNHYTKIAGIDKKDLYVVSIVPCIAKKYEAARPEFAPEGIRDVDAVLTSSEMLRMAELKYIDPESIVPQEFDDPISRFQVPAFSSVHRAVWQKQPCVWRLKSLPARSLPITWTSRRFAASRV
jgi:iron only hydrogenase large subunit-like protein